MIGFVFGTILGFAVIVAILVYEWKIRVREKQRVKE